MTHKKLSNEEYVQLIKQIDKYFYEINREQLKCLKFTEIAKYLSKIKGYDIPEQFIRRNKEISGYVEKLKSQTRNAIQSNAIVYVRLDVNQFLQKNHTTTSLKKALIERDQYYNSICELAFKISNEDRLLNKKLLEKTESNKALIEENQKI